MGVGLVNLDEWAATWHIPPAALLDLRARLGESVLPALMPSQSDGSESRMQSQMRLAAAADGVWLTRNNVGALLDDRGVPVRYGLANESKAQNEVVKSADLIGIRPIQILPAHVGRVIGQFVSREVKHEGWKWTGSAREQAQMAWAKFVVSKGGDAAIDSIWRP